MDESVSLLSLEDHAEEILYDRTVQRYVELAPKSVAPPCAPAFLLGPLPLAVGLRFYEERTYGHIRCYTLQNAAVTYEGVILHQNKLLHSPALNHPLPFVNGVLRRTLGGSIRNNYRSLDGQAILLAGPGSGTFGHWLIDFLPRLYVLAECGYDLSLLRFVVPVPGPSWTLQLLDLAGIRAEQIVLHKHDEEILIIEQLIVPTNMRQGSRAHPLFTNASAFLYNLIKNNSYCNAASKRTKRVFVSRKGGLRTLANRQEIEATAVRQGFAVIDILDMPLRDQIEMFASADIVAGEYGSALHLSMFSKPGTVVCALRGASFAPGWAQSGLGEVLRHPTGYVIAETPIEAVEQSFTINLTAAELAFKVSGDLAPNG